jgi:hypothetical protein
MATIFNLFFISIIVVAASVEYRIIKVEHCLTIDTKIAELKRCEATPAVFNLAIDVKKALNKIFVSSSRNLKLIS